MVQKYWFLWVLACLSQGLDAAIITGSFKGAVAGDPVEIWVPHEYIDGKKDRFKTVLDAQLAFSLEVKTLESQLVFLVFNEDRLPVFIESEDTLIIRADVFKFPLVVHFGGRGGGNNNLLQKYLQENQQDFNDFNNRRFKIGQWWASVEEPMNTLMEDLPPALFRDSLDKRKTAATFLVSSFSKTYPDALTPSFNTWITAEITYFWAYHLLFYGHVYASRHQVSPEFFDFLFDAPTIQDMIGSEWYRQFLLALMARQQHKTGQTDQFWAGQYQLAGQLLQGKSLAFFRSEMINIAFSFERYKEILPLFNDFMQNNSIPGYDEKVADLHQKFVKISPGAPAPYFAATDPTGRSISLDQLRGKVVYLNFWASWCGSCIKKMDVFNGYAQELNQQGIAIINVSVDANPENWRNALANWQFKGYQLLASEGKTNIATAYGVEAVPQYFIIQRNGTFADKASSSQPEDIRKKLLELSKSN